MQRSTCAGSPRTQNARSARSQPCASAPASIGTNANAAPVCRVVPLFLMTVRHCCGGVGRTAPRSASGRPRGRAHGGVVLRQNCGDATVRGPRLQVGQDGNATVHLRRFPRTQNARSARSQPGASAPASIGTSANSAPVCRVVPLFLMTVRHCCGGVGRTAPRSASGRPRGRAHGGVVLRQNCGDATVRGPRLRVCLCPASRLLRSAQP